jgi:hypothetical protein
MIDDHVRADLKAARHLLELQRAENERLRLQRAENERLRRSTEMSRSVRVDNEGSLIFEDALGRFEVSDGVTSMPTSFFYEQAAAAGWRVIKVLGDGRLLAYKERSRDYGLGKNNIPSDDPNALTPEQWGEEMSKA